MPIIVLRDYRPFTGSTSQREPALVTSQFHGIWRSDHRPA